MGKATVEYGKYTRVIKDGKVWREWRAKDMTDEDNEGLMYDLEWLEENGYTIEEKEVV